MRIVVQTWNGHISMRSGVLLCSAPAFCSADEDAAETALGVASGVATLTSNSEADGHTAAMGALDYTGTGLPFGWRPDLVTKDPYIQIDFSHILKITDVKLQGGKGYTGLHGSTGHCGAPAKIAVSYSADVAGNFVMLEEQPGFSDLFTNDDGVWNCATVHTLTKHVSLQWPIAGGCMHLRCVHILTTPLCRLQLALSASTSRQTYSCPSCASSCTGLGASTSMPCRQWAS